MYFISRNMTYFRFRSHINSNSFGVVPLRRATIPRAAMHSDQPLLQSTHAVEERREATDGELYTKFEFMNYYGNEAGLQLWNENERTDQPLLQSTDGAEERRVGFDGALYTYSDFTSPASFQVLQRRLAGAVDGLQFTRDQRQQAF